MSDKLINTLWREVCETKEMYQAFDASIKGSKSTGTIPANLAIRLAKVAFYLGANGISKEVNNIAGQRGVLGIMDWELLDMIELRTRDWMIECTNPDLDQVRPIPAKLKPDKPKTRAPRRSIKLQRKETP